LNGADLADEAMKDIVLPPLVEEPPIIADVVHTWNIEGWQQLAKREHGPTFEAGGYPW
jgi:ubiquitin carboxyl-terminal hydrolase 7